LANEVKKYTNLQIISFIIGCALYLAALIAAIVLWLTVGHLYPMDYLLLAMYIVMPVAFLVSSFFIGRGNVFGNFKWLSLILYMAAAPVICLLVGCIDFRMGLLSGVPAVIGLAIGHIFYIASTKKRLKKEKNIKPPAASTETIE